MIFPDKEGAEEKVISALDDTTDDDEDKGEYGGDDDDDSDGYYYDSYDIDDYDMDSFRDSSSSSNGFEEDGIRFFPIGGVVLHHYHPKITIIETRIVHRYVTNIAIIIKAY